MLELLRSTSGVDPCVVGGDSLPGDIGGETGGSGDCRGGGARPAKREWNGGVEVYRGAPKIGGRGRGAPRYWAPRTGAPPYLLKERSFI